MRRVSTRRRIVAAFAVACVATAGCRADHPPATRGDGGTEATAPAGSRARSAATERPPDRTDTLRIEGMAEPLRVHLYRPPPEAPIAFTTYIPADMIVTGAASGAGYEVGVVADFAGKPEPRARLVVVFLPAGSDADARAAFRADVARLRGAGAAEAGATYAGSSAGADPARLPWALEARRIDRDCPGARCMLGLAALASHAGRFFEVIWQYPAEYADGMAPRIDLMLREWRWSEGGGGLVAESYRSPPGFPIPFATEVPVGTRASVDEGGGPGAGLRFDLPGDDTYVNVFVFPLGTPREVAEAQAEGFVSDLGTPVSRGLGDTKAEPDARLSWSVEQVPFRYGAAAGQTFDGAVLVVAHGGRFLDLTIHGPSPRSRWWGRIEPFLRRWRWADGEPLTRRQDLLSGAPTPQP